MGATFTLPLWEVLDLTDNIGLSDYPIFDEVYRETLNRKIRRHFWNQEIGQETISMFQLAMSRLMDEIMPYYNEQYKLSKLEIDPLSTVNISNIVGSTTNTESNSGVETESDADAKSRAVASEYPQQSLRPGSDYASSSQDNITENKGKSSSTESRTDVQDGTVDSTTTGYNGHSAQLIAATRAVLVNIDLMIINEIEQAGIFMLIYSIPDNFINPKGYGYGNY